MALKDKLSDISCDKQTDIQNYINAFDINEDSINFETLSNYDDSSYVLNAYNLNNLNNNINNMQDNWNNDVNNYLDDKAELFQSWIDNLGNNVKYWQSGPDYQYYKNEIVAGESGSIILCCQNCTGGEPLPRSSNDSHYDVMTRTSASMGVVGKIGLGDGYNSSSYSYKLDIYYKYKTTDGIEEHYLKFNDAKDLELNVIEGNIEDWDSVNKRIQTSYNNNRYIELSLFSAFVENTNGWTQKSLVYTLTGYSNNDEVGNYYINIQSTITDYWVSLNIKGYAGQNTYNLNYIGEFNWEWEAFLVNDVVYVNNNDTIDFYVCISNVSYSSVNTPENDTEHWVSLFTIYRDRLMIYDEMPNQDFFDNPNSPSVFGVISPISSSTVKFIDRIRSESASNPKYLQIIAKNSILYRQDNTSYNFFNYLNNWLYNNNFVS